MTPDEITTLMDTSLLLRISGASRERQTWEQVRADADALEDADRVRVADGVLDEAVVEGLRVRDVTALHALAATTTLVRLLTGWQWIDMRDAREQDATWREIGAAVGMTRQGAHDWYRRAIERQEEHVPDLHDTARSRAVL